MTDYNEQQVTKFIDAAVVLYQSARRSPDPYVLVWVARFQYDVCAGLSYQESAAKHLGELARELGQVSPTPTPAPIPTPVQDLSEENAKRIVLQTGVDRADLLAAFVSQDTADVMAEAFRDVVLANLRLAGFNAARQRNPSQRISGDKVAIFVNQQWQCYDITSVIAGQATLAHINFTPGANPVLEGPADDQVTVSKQDLLGQPAQRRRFNSVLGLGLPRRV